MGILWLVGDSDGELWTRTTSCVALHRLSLQERIASALLELHVPHCLGYDQRQKGPQAADFAEASSSHAPKGLVAMAG